MALERFTLIGATTRFGLLTPPMRARFGLVERLNFYPDEDLRRIVHRSASILEVPIDDDGAVELARRSRGTPRVANRLLRRVRDFAEVRADGAITATVAADALAQLNVDEFGLDDMDSRILKTIIEKFGGGPVGVNTIAVAVGEDAERSKRSTSRSSSSKGSSSVPRAGGVPPPLPTAGSVTLRLSTKQPSLTAELPRRTSDFDYQLPPDLIAQEPLPDRAASRLLVVRRHEAGSGAGLFPIPCFTTFRI